ncbi:hypothetical protein [Streptomyces lavendulae]|uniref:hypothetical protein n=1 Tax=Streptomyces lavendulae TaxID=1914 RepID=UPI0033D139C0
MTPIRRGVGELREVQTGELRNRPQLSPGDCQVLLAHAPASPASARENTVRVMFDALGAARVYLANTSALVLHEAGVLTGTALELGHEVCTAAPVDQGYTFEGAVTRLDAAGREVTERLADLLGARPDFPAGAAGDPDVMQRAKEDRCEVADSAECLRCDGPECEPRSPYTLPDGTGVTIGSERWCAPEGLFAPERLGFPDGVPGIHEITHAAIMDCEDVTLRRYLYANIILAGGTSLIPGLPERLRAEIARLAPDGLKNDVRVLQAGPHAAWHGGAMLALTMQDTQWIAIQRYELSGPSIARWRCAFPESRASGALRLLNPQEGAGGDT